MRVKILYACEAGSRALGFEAKDSDYDIRFIYIHKQNWYLSIDQYRDVIEIPKEDTLSIIVDPKLDVVGWELSKTPGFTGSRILPCWEWLNSKHVYCSNTRLVENLKLMQETVISQKTYINHHLNLAKRNFLEMQKKEEWKGKLYLYIFRSILSAKWIQIYQEIPPVEFTELLSIIEDNRVKSEVGDLFSMKKSGEHYLLDEHKILNEFIKHEICLLGRYAKLVTQKVDDPTRNLNELFRVTLEEVWK